MSGFKQRIKAHIPRHILHLYDVVKILPAYIRAVIRGRRIRLTPVKMYSDTEAVDRIVREGCSMSRYGDGEFRWMLGMPLNSYQDYSLALGQALVEAFQCEQENVLIGVPRGIYDDSGLRLLSKMYWKIFRVKYMPRVEKWMDPEKVYCNASMTRPYIDYAAKDGCGAAFENLKRIWQGRDVVIVEGEKTKLGMGNDLLDNAASVRRIIGPATNAFEHLDEVCRAVRERVEKDALILGALGPAASVLAVRLAREGYQFVDVGHIDIEYVWYQKSAAFREQVEGKYVNENGSKDKRCSDIYDRDEKYLNSIIAKVSGETVCG